MQLLLWGLLAWWPAAEVDQAQWRHLRHVYYFVQTVLQFTLLPFLLANLVAWLSQLSWLDELGLIAVGMAYLLVAFV
ncbi:CPBP family intramembrane glutamate endopeptidase, partial [Lactiplantibacillus plantarum]